jgi:hypothetical protein
VFWLAIAYNSTLFLKKNVFKDHIKIVFFLIQNANQSMFRICWEYMWSKEFIVISWQLQLRESLHNKRKIPTLKWVSKLRVIILAKIRVVDFNYQRGS